MNEQKPLVPKKNLRLHKYLLHNRCGRVVQNSVFSQHQKDLDKLIHWFKKYSVSKMLVTAIFPHTRRKFTSFPAEMIAETSDVDGKIL